MTHSESGLSRAIVELEADLQALRLHQPARAPAKCLCRACQVSCTNLLCCDSIQPHAQAYDDGDTEFSTSHGQLPVVNIANMLEWKHAVTTKLAVPDKTGITLPLSS